MRWGLSRERPAARTSQEATIPSQWAEEMKSQCLKRRWPRRLTSAPASVDTVAAFRPWRSFQPSVARGRRGHHRNETRESTAASSGRSSVREIQRRGLTRRQSALNRRGEFCLISPGNSSGKRHCHPVSHPLKADGPPTSPPLGPQIKGGNPRADKYFYFGFASCLRWLTGHNEAARARPRVAPSSIRPDTGDRRERLHSTCFCRCTPGALRCRRAIPSGIGIGAFRPVRCRW